jgi:signal transduction histidine kinase
MQNFKIGIAIFKEESGYPLVFNNSALVEMLETMRRSDTDSQKKLINESLQQINNCLDSYCVKRIVESKKQEEGTTLSFKKFLELTNENSDCTYFLDIPQRFIELKASIITFEGNRAKIISFVDCSAAQRLEKAQNENRYKTLLISTISHELRTPVNAVLGSLEILSMHLSSEFSKVLRVAKDSCDMIIYHINDLTV